MNLWLYTDGKSSKSERHVILEKAVKMHEGYREMGFHIPYPICNYLMSRKAVVFPVSWIQRLFLLLAGRFFWSLDTSIFAFMGDYTHYYWFSDPLSSCFTITYGKAERMDAPYEIDENISNAVFFGIQAGLLEMAESPDEVVAAAAIGAAAGLGITLVSVAVPGTAVLAGITGIGLTIYEFCQDFKYICGIDGSYQKIREAAKLATVFAVTSLAAGAGAKVGGTAGSAASDKVQKVSLAVENEIKDRKIWKSTCDWMKKNILENAKAFTDDAGNLLDEAVISRVKGWLDNSKALLLYKYQTLKGKNIYAELKNLMDEDAFYYLQNEFYYDNVDIFRNKFKHLVDTADWIKAAHQIKGGKLREYEVIYIENAVINGNIPQETVFKTIKGEVSSNLTVPTLQKGSLPKGEYAIEKKNEDIILQNDTARILADAGYDIRMLPELPGGNGYGKDKTKNPDYLMMNDRVFDCYSPMPKTKSSNICNKISHKVKNQADRIVLNVSRISKDQLGDLKEIILQKTEGTGDLRELQELIVVFEDGRIETWFAR